MKIMKNKKQLNGFTLTIAVIFLSVFAVLIASMATANTTSVQDDRDARMTTSAARFGLEMAKYLARGGTTQVNSANGKLKNSDIIAAWKSMCDSIIAHPVIGVPANSDNAFRDKGGPGKELVTAPFRYGTAAFTLRFYKYNKGKSSDIAFTVESTATKGDLSRTYAMDFKVAHQSIKLASSQQPLSGDAKVTLTVIPLQETCRLCP